MVIAGKKSIDKTLTSQNDEAAFESRKKLLSKAELSIWLDGYDDIFSDFDSRSFAERALSDDFINEVKKMAKEKSSGVISLSMLIPANRRDKSKEETIIRSLHAHFRLFAQQSRNEIRKIYRKGWLLNIGGLFILSGAAFLANLPSQNYFINILRITTEPFGLFLVWTGLEHIFYHSGKRKPEFEFNRRMSHAEITFLTF